MLQTTEAKAQAQKRKAEGEEGGGKRQKTTASYVPNNILITGGAGFIGSGVVTHFVKKYSEYKVVVVDKISYNSNIKNLSEIQSNPNYSFVQADICDFEPMVEILKTHNIDTVMHFAAETHVDRSFLNSLQFTHNNVVGTHVLLEAVRKLSPQIKRFVHVSTDEVYGTCLSNESAKDENATFEPTNPYAATKAAAEHLVNSYRISYGIPSIITRGSNVYGRCQFPDKLIPKFINLLERGSKLPIHGDGSVLRSFIYIDDVAEAFDCVVHNAQVGDTYNVSNGYEASVLDVSKMLLEAFGVENPEERLSFTRDRHFNDRRYFISHDALTELGWKSKVSFKEGLKRTIEWYRSHPNYWEQSDIVNKSLEAHPEFILEKAEEG